MDQAHKTGRIHEAIIVGQLDFWIFPSRVSLRPEIQKSKNPTQSKTMYTYTTVGHYTGMTVHMCVRYDNMTKQHQPRQKEAIGNCHNSVWQFHK